MAGWVGAAELDLKAAGAEPLPEGRSGVRLKEWHVESFNGPILNSSAVERYALLVFQVQNFYFVVLFVRKNSL
jgi:hypothetical protein